MNRYTFRLDGEGELARKLQERAASTETNRSKVIRQALQAYLSARLPAAEAEAAAFAELARAVNEFRIDFGHVGGNLNQLAHYYNIHGEVQPDTEAAAHRELLRQFMALRTILRRINDELAGRVRR